MGPKIHYENRFSNNEIMKIVFNNEGDVIFLRATETLTSDQLHTQS